jgi:hypothetical protein
MSSGVGFIKRSLVWLTVSYAIFALMIASTGAWLVYQLLAAPYDPAAFTAESVPARRPTVVVTKLEKRKVYPYSIVPGGARSLHEAKIAMRDPSVSNHYAAFDLSKLRQVTLNADMVGYVSYRYSGEIYWTAKKIRFKAGETVYTDGTHVARGRCLNCYSAFPMMPTRPHEPTEKAMDAPVEMPLVAMEFPGLPLEETHALPPPPAELTPSVPTFPAGGPEKPGGGFWFPLIPIIPPIHRHSPGVPSTGTTATGTPPVVPPISPTGPTPPPPTTPPPTTPPPTTPPPTTPPPTTPPPTTPPPTTPPPTTPPPTTPPPTTPPPTTPPPTTPPPTTPPPTTPPPTTPPPTTPPPGGPPPTTPPTIPPPGGPPPSTPPPTTPPPGGPPPTTPPPGGPPPVVPPPIIPPTVVTPEPEYRWFLVGAFSLVALIRMKRAKRLKRGKGPAIT